jgi:hypothetical protein
MYEHVYQSTFVCDSVRSTATIPRIGLETVRISLSHPPPGKEGNAMGVITVYM